MTLQFLSVYSSPEAGLTASNQPSSNNILNKFAGRKSGRQRPFMKQSTNRNNSNFYLKHAA